MEVKICRSGAGMKICFNGKPKFRQSENFSVRCATHLVLLLYLPVGGKSKPVKLKRLHSLRCQRKFEISNCFVSNCVSSRNKIFSKVWKRNTNLIAFFRFSFEFSNETISKLVAATFAWLFGGTWKSHRCGR